MSESIPSINILHILEDDDDEDRGIEIEVEAFTSNVGHDKSLLSSFDYTDLPPTQSEIQQWRSAKSLRPGMR